MTEPLVVTAYQCPFCNKVSRTIAGIKVHIHKCRNNDEEPRCRRCRWLSAETDYESDFRHITYFCNIKDAELTEEVSSCQQFEFIPKSDREEVLRRKYV